VKRPITISAELASELCDVLAGLCGFAEGTSNALATLKSTAAPLIARGEAASDKLRPLLAESIAEEQMKELRR
jgi:hypothetical protein